MTAMAKALFYVCKAMGPGREDGNVVKREVRRLAWWAWFDVARAWVEGPSMRLLPPEVDGEDPEPIL